MSSDCGGSSTTMNDSSVTMVDVLNNEKELEEESAAVLGNSDEKNCTFGEGYVRRQALYSCLTCLPEAREDFEKGAGICLACSYACHEKHELIELYTKRDFRCDCGGPKMAMKCILEPKKEQVNDKNRYNQNYSGVYCTCHRPYPDPDETSDDEMIQCIMCEDWFHSKHLDAALPPSNDFSEMVCGSCMTKHQFLADYASLSIYLMDSLDRNESASTNKDDVDELNQCVMDIISQVSAEEGSEASEPKKVKMEDPVTNKCTKPSLNNSYKKGATFWPNNWRQNLCKCEPCLSVYKEAHAEFLTDLDDTVQSYEEAGIKKNEAKESDYDRGMRELSSLDRTKQIDAITAYNKMKDRLKEYLHQFVTNQQVVTEADVKRFFQEMKNEDQKEQQSLSDQYYV